MGHAKRKFTSRLPADWRELVWNAISPTSMALRDAVAVLWLTGCRPKELGEGITVEINRETPDWGEVLVFTIGGAKVGKIRDKNGVLHDRGQPERCIAVAIDSEPARYLAERIRRKGSRKIRYHRKGISNRLSEVSRRVFPRKREHLSAYCFRHAFSSALKDSVSERSTTAAALGHLSDYSQFRYGRKSRSGGGMKKPPILDAFGSRHVKHSKKTDRLLGFKIAKLNAKRQGTKVARNSLPSGNQPTTTENSNAGDGRDKPPSKEM